MNKLIQVFTSPGKTFEELMQDATWWQPAVVIIVLSIVAAVAVAQVLDPTAAIEAQLQAMAESGSPQAQIDAVRQAMAAQQDQAQGGGTMMLMTYGIAAIMVPVIYFITVLLHTVYYMVVGKIFDAGVDFGDWFALMNWVRMPLAILAIFTILVALLSSGITTANDLSYLSFAYWLTIPNEGGMVVGQFLWSLDLIVLWTIALSSIAFNKWTDCSMAVSVAIAAAPYVVIYGILMVV